MEIAIHALRRRGPAFLDEFAPPPLVSAAASDLLGVFDPSGGGASSSDAGAAAARGVGSGLGLSEGAEDEDVYNDSTNDTWVAVAYPPLPLAAAGGGAAATASALWASLFAPPKLPFGQAAAPEAAVVRRLRRLLRACSQPLPWKVR